MASTAAKYAKLEGKADFSNGKTSSTLYFPMDLFSGENQEQVTMTLFFNKIKGNTVSLGLAKKSFLRSPYGDVPIIHGKFSSGLMKKDGGKEVFSDLYHRSDDSITLPIPESLAFQWSASWAQVETGDLGAAINQMSDLSEENKAEVAKGLLSRVGMSGAEALGKGRGVNLGATIQAGLGFAVNQYPEALFKGMGFRTVPFSWKMTPRSQDESVAIQNIARMIRFHMVPEWMKRNGEGNNFMLFPSTVDVVFWLGDKPHPYIPRMMTAAITAFEMTETPNGGFNPMTDGAPQSVVLSLQLTELRQHHKEMVASNTHNTSF